MKVGLIQCPLKESKGEGPLFLVHSNSALFRHSHAYCRANYDKVYALSGALGLIEITRHVIHHRGGIHHLKYKVFTRWIKKVVKQIDQIIPKGTELYFHCGNKYQRIIRYLPSNKYKCYTPMKGTPIGKQLRFYKDYFYNEDKSNEQTNNNQ